MEVIKIPTTNLIDCLMKPTGLKFAIQIQILAKVFVLLEKPMKGNEKKIE